MSGMSPSASGGDPSALMSAGQGSTAMGGMGTIVAQVAQGVSGFFVNMFQAGVAANNARLAKQNQEAALQAGERSESEARMRGAYVGSTMQVATAANNIESGSGSALASRLSQKTLTDMDALTIRYNAARQAYGYGVEAEMFHEQRNLDTLGAVGGLVGSMFGSIGSYIGTSTALQSQALSAEQAGIQGY